MFRSRSWFGGGWGRPKNPHSLDHLKYLYNVLARNQTVSEHNRGLLVESLRSIAEILIWGDQNDSSVFDFFLEKNMLSFFLRIMRQRSGGSSYVCVQLLQTLNILFENIRNETSLYYLLSNNHVNSIIVHKFDFSDEEVMAYYISFLKTLSFKLNGHTIHFFYNEHTNDFPLYTEAIKFFNHRESMVRIAVRTLTLNVYRVEDASMLRFIRDRTAAPYFSNLVWFIGKHILELDVCVRNDADHLSQQKLSDLVAEHLDHLHYLNDILCLNISDLNQVLTEHLLHKLFIPLYIYSLTSSEQHRARLSSKRNSSPINSCNSDQIQHLETITRNLAAILNHQPSSPIKTTSRDDADDEEQKPRVSCVVSLFLLSQVFLIITHAPLVHALAWIILHSNNSVFEDGATKILENYLKGKQGCIKLEFAKPSESLEKALAVNTANIDKYEPHYEREMSVEIPIKQLYQYNDRIEHDPDLVCNSVPSTSQASSTRNNSSEDLINSEEESVNRTLIEEYNRGVHNVPDSPLPDAGSQDNMNITDEEKEQIAISTATTPAVEERLFDLVATETRLKTADTKPFLETILKSLDCSENDYIALFALCLLYALVNNKGINPELLDVILTPSVKAETSSSSGSSAAELSTPMARASCAVPLYSETLVDKLINIVQLSCQPSCRVRLVSLELSLKLLSQAAGGPCSLPPVPSAPAASGSTPPYVQGSAAPQRRARAVQAAKLHAAALLRTFYKTDDIFLDMFEDEYCEMCKRPLNVEWLCMDAAILLPPTGTPMTGIAFTKRLPCGEVERARRAIRAYFLIRELSLILSGEVDNQLPLTNPLVYVQIGNVLDLNNSDLIACTIVLKDGTKSRRFMVIDPIQIILVEPEQKRLGWGVAKLVGSLQDLEVGGDKEDSRCLHLRVLRAPGQPTPRQPLLQAKFVFDDHIRCMAAKQRLTKGRLKARQKKMQQIGRLLEVSGSSAPSAPPAPLSARTHRPLFSAGARVPGFAAALRRDSLPGASPRSAHRLDRSGESGAAPAAGAGSPGYEREVAGSYFSNATHKVTKADSASSSRPPTDQRRSSSSGYRRQEAAGRRSSRDNSAGNRSRSGSPRMPRPRSEEIPLENMASEHSAQNRAHHPMVQSRLASPDLLQACAPVDKDKNVPPADPPAETSFIRLKKKSIIETI